MEIRIFDPNKLSYSLEISTKHNQIKAIAKLYLHKRTISLIKQKQRNQEITTEIMEFRD